MSSGLRYETGRDMPPGMLEKVAVQLAANMATDSDRKKTDPNDCIKKTKRKTNFAKIIVTGTPEKPYYDIMWFDYMDGQYHIGYGSYNLNFVFQWLAECFEIEDAPTVDAAEVVHGWWIKDGDVVVCSNCGEEHGWDEYRASYCEDCGAKMDGDGNV